MRESIIWDWFSRNKPVWLAATRFEAISPDGVADVFFTDKRTQVSGWLEFKYCEPDNIKYIEGLIPTIKPAQSLFLVGQAMNNVPCGILLRVGNERWHFWRVPPDRNWARDIKTVKAIGMATNTWPSLAVYQLLKSLGLPL